jgi:hypothetical protein
VLALIPWPSSGSKFWCRVSSLAFLGRLWLSFSAYRLQLSSEISSFFLYQFFKAFLGIASSLCQLISNFSFSHVVIQYFDRDDSASIVNVNEDHQLIEELGFDVWWNLVQNGLVGLIEGTTAKGQNVYRFTLTQGRVPLVCLYTEDEYKELIVEAHYGCCYHFYRVQGKDKRRWY